MKHYFITFRSITFAQRAEQLLSRSGVWCTLQRTPRWMEEQGCGYALRIRTKDIRQAGEQLRQAKVPLRRIYWQKDDGMFEEVDL